MADIELVIKIPEVEYKRALKRKELFERDLTRYERLLVDATPYKDRLTGHWIDGDDKCPCCGKSKFEGLDADIWADWQPKYCPNCGTKMT